MLQKFVYVIVKAKKKKRKIGISESSEKKIGRFLGKKKKRKIGRKKKSKIYQGLLFRDVLLPIVQLLYMRAASDQHLTVGMTL